MGAYHPGKLNGTYYMTRAVLPNMIERQIGDIINISSTGIKRKRFDECL
jgi:NADP-dependent 3-hydroxy acid dehydrogenase YdfG